MIVVTGGSGKLGRACIRNLLEHGHEVLNVDLTPPSDKAVRFSRVDVTDFGDTLAALSGIDERVTKASAVVHLAAIPAAGLATNHATFATNMLSTYNVFEAARQLGITNVVWASSETVFGVPYNTPPQRLPVDETIDRPETAYSLSKALGEDMAEHFCRWNPVLKIIGLRFSNVMEPHDYAAFPGFDADARGRHWNLWTYIDARDGAEAIRLALESTLTGAHVFGIANADSVMSRSNANLVAEVYPGTSLSGSVGPNETLISIDKARAVLGYVPKHSWRDEVGSEMSTQGTVTP